MYASARPPRATLWLGVAYIMEKKRYHTHKKMEVALSSSTFFFIFFKSANADVLFHFRADAPIIGHFWEFIHGNELNLKYDSSGNCEGSVERTPAKPKKLRWSLNQEAVATLQANMGVRNSETE